jgi:hypothetical protein
MSRFLLIILASALFAAGAFGQAPTLRVVVEDPNLPADLYYGNTKVKPLRLRPGTNQPVTINDADFYITQHYVDFLSRFPDQGGFDYWTNQITQCGTNAACLLDRRVSVSAAFFIEQEFQNTGSYVYRFYKGGLGRVPLYAEFTPDRHQVVGGATLEASKAAYAEAFTQRADFLTAYPANLTPDAFVTRLIDNIKNMPNGVDLTSQKSALLATLNGPGGTRGKTVRQAIEDPAFVGALYNPAFVTMQYFGYLKRDPEQGGYDFWLNVLNNKAPNNFRGMVCSFVTSQEYQERFGSTVSYSNRDCNGIH